MRKYSVLLSVLLLSAMALQTPMSLLAASPAADRPVTLADARSFDGPAESPGITLDEITAARQRLSSAVSADKFVDGAKVVLLVAILFVAMTP